MFCYNGCLMLLLEQAGERRKREAKTKMKEKENWTKKSSKKASTTKSVPAKKSGPMAGVKRQRDESDKSEENKSEDEESIEGYASNKKAKRL